jgi:hypothetical protein
MALAGQAVGQKIKSDDIEYQYRRLPMIPLGASVSHFNVIINAAYEEKNKKMVADYEAAKKAANDKYQKEMAAYPALVKQAEDKYEAELAEYNKKSLGQKILEKNVLGENNKPVKQLPSKPYLETVSAPVLMTTYDYEALGNTYINIGGMQRNSSNALQVIVTLQGFDFTQPRTISEQKNVYNISTKSTGMATYYKTEFSYRHPMTVKVLAADGKELLNITPQELNVYKIYSTPSSERPGSVNPELLVKTHEEKVLQSGLAFINDLLNDKFGFGYVKQKATLQYVKEKGDEYADLMTAFNEASSGLSLLQNDEATAKTKLQQAVTLWNNALKESDPSNKKARIDKDVTLAIYFNLLEAHFALGDADAGRDVLAKMNALSMSNSERTSKLEFEKRFTDLKTRKQNNQ